MRLTKYNYYHWLKTRFEYKYKGIALNKYLAFSFAKYAFRGIQGGPVTALLLFFTQPNKTYLTTLCHSLIPITKHKDRQDYLEQVEQIASIVHGSNIISKPNHAKQTFYIAPLNILKAIQVALHFSYNNKISSPLFIVTIASKLTFAFNLIDRLSSIKEIRVKKFIAFNCSNLDDNLLVQFFQSKNIPTYTIQHAYYSAYPKEIQFDIINYENFTADYMLCWGNETINMLTNFGIEKNRLLLAGNVKYTSFLPITLSDKKWGELSIVVMTARDLLDKENKALIKLLASDTSGNRYYIKLHPSLNLGDYLQLKTNSISFLNNDSSLKSILKSGNYDAGIAFNSTSYYDSLMSGIPTYQYINNNIEIINGLEGDFNSLASLERNMSNDNIFEPNKVKSLLQDNFGLGVNAYSELLKI